MDAPGTFFSMMYRHIIDWTMVEEKYSKTKHPVIVAGNLSKI